MSLTNQIAEIWRQGNWEPPQVSLAVDNNSETYIVIEDRSPIFRLMDRYGNILAVAQSSCRQVNGNYRCNPPLHIVTCRTLTERDYYVLDNIHPIVFGDEDISDN